MKSTIIASFTAIFWYRQYIVLFEVFSIHVRCISTLTCIVVFLLVSYGTTRTCREMSKFKNEQKNLIGTLETN